MECNTNQMSFTNLYTGLQFWTRLTINLRTTGIGMATTSFPNAVLQLVLTKTYSSIIPLNKKSHALSFGNHAGYVMSLKKGNYRNRCTGSRSRRAFIEKSPLLVLHDKYPCKINGRAYNLKILQQCLCK